MLSAVVNCTSFYGNTQCIVFFFAHFTELPCTETLGKKYFLICKKLVQTFINKLKEKFNMEKRLGGLSICDIM